MHLSETYLYSQDVVVMIRTTEYMRACMQMLTRFSLRAIPIDLTCRLI